jgi:endonuclease/exonuclease/phosphatase family metal-dependent hydrolase
MKLSILSYNLNCSNSSYLQERIQYISKAIVQRKSDLIALQEVSKPICKLFNTIFSEFYTIVQDFMNSNDVIGNVIFCRNGVINILDAYKFDLKSNSRTSRSAIYCEFNIMDVEREQQHRMNIINCQLEKTWNGHPIRLNQMESILSLDEIKNNTILLGDFSILSNEEKANKLLQQSGFKDAWVEMGMPSELNYTYDYKKNTTPNMEKYRSRQDRILYNFQLGQHVKVKEFTFMGYNPLKINNDVEDLFVYPSSHFGICTVLHF